MEAGLPLLCAKARGCRWFRKTSHHGCLELKGPERIGHILDDSLSKAVRQPRFDVGELVLQRGFDTLGDRLLARSEGAIHSTTSTIPATVARRVRPFFVSRRMRSLDRLWRCASLWSS